METEKKTVLITGADAGLGLSLVKRFLQGGCVVFAGVHRSMDALNLLAAEYSDALSPILLNVADLESVRAAARQVSEQTNTLDIVINNAGIHLKNSQGLSRSWISPTSSFSKRWKSTPLAPCASSSSSTLCWKREDGNSS